MNNAVARVGQQPSSSGALTLDPDQLRAVSPELATVIRRYWRGEGADRVPGSLVREARSRLEELEPLMRPAPQTAVLDWLEAIGRASLPQSPTTKAMLGSMQAIWEVCEALPAAVWCKETRLAFLSQQRFWPAPADVYSFLKPYADALSRQRGGCKAVIACARAEIECADDTRNEGGPSAATLETVANLTRSFTEGVTQKRAEGIHGQSSRPSVRASYLPPAVLLATYEEMARVHGNENVRAMAAHRAAMLRSSMGLEKT